PSKPASPLMVAAPPNWNRSDCGLLRETAAPGSSFTSRSTARAANGDARDTKRRTASPLGLARSRARNMMCFPQGRADSVQIASRVEATGRLLYRVLRTTRATPEHRQEGAG